MKFAQVRYGTYQHHDGEETPTYTYVVSDTVRIGDNLTVTAIHAGNERKLFATTGHLPPSENGGGLSNKMPEIKDKNGNAKDLTQEDLLEGYKAKELGVKKGYTGGIYGGIDTEKPNAASLEVRGRALEVAYKSLTDKGKTPKVSEGTKTSAALDYVTKQEQSSGKYETYEDYMARTQKRREE